ncbi:hypothetical protein [Francisella sp. SYW-2]|uniref:hypothetical protein n=1 Tax=Francisella sp. SYW-2 TaxID=2610886 RepID=UPI00123E268A|nr:hypothetical protein [Francisella sp. SYW-2]
MEKVDREFNRFDKSIEKLNKQIEELKRDSVSKAYLMKIITGFGIGLSLLGGLGMKVSFLEDLKQQDGKIISLFNDVVALSDTNSSQNKVLDHLKEYYINHSYHNGYDKYPTEGSLDHNDSNHGKSPSH